LLVFKQAAAPHLILYSQQLHPSHQPLLQLLTLGNATHFLDAIARLRHHPDAIDFAHRLTGAEINKQVDGFTSNVLQSVGLSPTLDLNQQYQHFLPLLFTENLGDLSVPGKYNKSFSSASLSPSPSSVSESHPWSIISRLTDTISNLSDRILQQNERLIELQFNSTLPKPNISDREPNKEQLLSEKKITLDKTIANNHLENLTSLSSEELRTSRARGVAAEKLRRALDAVLTYNQQQPDSRFCCKN
jgi:hypothetical protein